MTYANAVKCMANNLNLFHYLIDLSYIFRVELYLIFLYINLNLVMKKRPNGQSTIQKEAFKALPRLAPTGMASLEDSFDLLESEEPGPLEKSPDLQNAVNFFHADMILHEKDNRQDDGIAEEYSQKKLTDSSDKNFFCSPTFNMLRASQQAYDIYDLDDKEVKHQGIELDEQCDELLLTKGNDSIYSLSGANNNYLKQMTITR